MRAEMGKCGGRGLWLGRREGVLADAVWEDGRGRRG